MTNLNKYGEMNLESGYRADEIIKILINNGFFISCEGVCGTNTQYQVFKQKPNET